MLYRCVDTQRTCRPYSVTDVEVCFKNGPHVTSRCLPVPVKQPDPRRNVKVKQCHGECQQKKKAHALTHYSFTRSVAACLAHLQTCRKQGVMDCCRVFASCLTGRASHHLCSFSVPQILCLRSLLSTAFTVLRYDIRISESPKLASTNMDHVMHRRC